jgi:hypothetical protein
MARHVCTPFDGCYKPSALRWWHETIPGARWDGSAYGHLEVMQQMVMGRSADDMEALAYCFQRTVIEGARSASGRMCVCLSEKAPAAGEARGAAGSDGMSSQIALLQDLYRAADGLPISWGSTQAIFEAQGRMGVFRPRYVYYRNNLRVREIDRWLEPRDSETGRPRSRSLAYYLMAVTLGGAQTECRWPKTLSLVERDVFARKLKEAA